MRPILRLMHTCAGNKVFCDVHNEEVLGNYIRIRDKGEPEKPQVICEKCVDLLFNMIRHKCYVYDWKEPVRR